MLLLIRIFKNYVSGPRNFELRISWSAIYKRLPTVALDHLAYVTAYISLKHFSCNPVFIGSKHLNAADPECMSAINMSSA